MKTLEPQILQRLLWEIGRSQRDPPQGAAAADNGGWATPLAENTLLLWADPGVPPAVLLRLAKHELVRLVTSEPVYSSRASGLPIILSQILYSAAPAQRIAPPVFHSCGAEHMTLQHLNSHNQRKGSGL